MDMGVLGEPEGVTRKVDVVESWLRRGAYPFDAPLVRPLAPWPPPTCGPLGRDERVDFPLGLGSGRGERPKTELLPPTLLPIEDRMGLPGVSPLTSRGAHRMPSGEEGGVLSSKLRVPPGIAGAWEALTELCRRSICTTSV